MFAGHEKNVAKALLFKHARFLEDVFARKRPAQNGVVAREAAVFAIVNALDGEIERREEPNRFAETLNGERMGSAAEFFEAIIGAGRNQRSEIRQRQCGFLKRGDNVSL